MKRFLLLFSIFIFTICTAWGQFSAKKYNVSGINGIRAGWSFQIELESGDSNEITVIAPSQTTECVVIKKENGILTFDLDFSKVTTKSTYPNGFKIINDEIIMTKGRKSLKGPIKVKMKMSQLGAVILSSDAQLITKGTFKGGRLICSLSGNSSITETRIAIETLNADISGNSKISFSGSFKDINVELNGNSSCTLSGDFYKGDISQTGSSSFELNGKSNSLSLCLSGASKAVLEGTTQTLKIKNNGTSSLQCDNFNTRTADLSLSGACGVNISVLQSLTAQVSGTSRLNYEFRGDSSKLKIQKLDAAKIQSK